MQPFFHDSKNYFLNIRHDADKALTGLQERIWFKDIEPHQEIGGLKDIFVQKMVSTELNFFFWVMIHTDLVGSSFMRYDHKDGVELTFRTVKPAQSMNSIHSFVVCDLSKNLVHNLFLKKSVTNWRLFTVTDGGCKDCTFLIQHDHEELNWLFQYYIEDIEPLSWPIWIQRQQFLHWRTPTSTLNAFYYLTQRIEHFFFFARNVLNCFFSLPQRIELCCTPILAQRIDFWVLSHVLSIESMMTFFLWVWLTELTPFTSTRTSSELNLSFKSMHSRKWT